MNSSNAFLYGGALIVGSLFLMTLLRGRRRMSMPASRERIESLREQRDLEEGLERVLIELQDMSRKNIAILDTKMRLLQQLIVDADARIRTLRGEAPAPAASPAPSSPGGARDELHQKVFDMADRGLDAHQIGRELSLERGEIELILGLRKVDVKE